MGHSLKKRDQSQEAHPKKGGRLSWVRRLEEKRDSIITDRIVPAFGRLLNIALRYRYVSAAIAIATLMASLGMFQSGRVEFTFLGESDTETLIVDVRMPIGVPIEETAEVVRAIENAALAQRTDGEPEVQSVSTIIGQQQDLETLRSDVASPHVAQVFIELVPVEQRDRESNAIIDSIRTEIGEVASLADSISFSGISGGPGGPDITVEVLGERLDAIESAVADIKSELRAIAGVVDVTDDNYAGQREIQVSLKPSGAALGFTEENVARQLRGALFGLEAHVFSAKREDIDVRVRFDESTRRDLFAIENLWLISPAGNPVPMTEVAQLREGSSYSTIKRIDRQRAISVTADTSLEQNPEIVMAQFPLDEIRRNHPDVRIQLGGRQKNLSDAMATLPLGFGAALIMIYVILAWLFSSYTQPIAVMLAIPFGIIGVIWGHFILGYQLTFLSLIGFVALSGIVVNDSLILVEYYNTLRREGKSVRDGLVEASMRRLRPIFLTTITTICGLTPLMLEQSFQAKFLIPMAIAISFGLMSATVLILMVLPCIIVIIEDIKRAMFYLWHGRPRPEPMVVGASDLVSTPE